MASKNEIKHRISLEGDDDVKRRLKAVGEAGKQALADTEKRLSAARSFAERQSAGGPAIGALNKLRAPAEVLGGALSPFAEGAGVAGLLGRIGGIFKSPGGIYGTIAATLGAIGLHLAKVRGETEKEAKRLGAFGGGPKAVSQLNASAKRLGIDPTDLGGDFENFLTYRRKRIVQGADGIHPPGFAEHGDAAANEQFLAAQRTLLAGAKEDRTPADKAGPAVSQFLSSLFADHPVAGSYDQAPGLTADAIRNLASVSPADANRVARVVGRTQNQRFGNVEELAEFTERSGRPIEPNTVLKALQRDEPNAMKDAKAARGVGDAFDGLKASFGRLDKSFSELGGKQAEQGTVAGIDQVTGGVDAATDAVRRLPQTVQEMRDAANQPGAAFQSNQAFIGETNKYSGPLREPEPMPLPQPRPPEAPGLTGGVRVQYGNGPDAVQEHYYPRSNGGDYLPGPEGRQPVVPTDKRSEIDNQQDVSATAFNNALDDAGDGLKRFASILADIRSGQNSDTAGKPKTVTFATGGPVARWFDGGGHVSGPGTTTSDSIPAWLSDKEYVIQASAAKKVGRGFLDWVNAGAPGYADGGAVVPWTNYEFWDKNKKTVFDDPDMEAERNTFLFHHPFGDSEKRTAADLGQGDHSITYDPLSGGAYIDGNLYLPGNPLLDDPQVKQAMQESMQGAGQQPSQKKHKSLFTGIFGGHVFGESGSYATGGPVGNVPSLQSYFARLAGGGSVAGGSGGLNVGVPALPQIDLPKLDYGDVPDLGDLASSGTSEAMHHVTIDLGGGRSVDGLRAPTDIVRQLSREAKDSANARIGVAPSWVYGRGR